ncbi:hypothetical protein [Streptomyces sp. NBC_01727]|nr:hypothetical protein OIE76_04625 [Streptomyces sp. NBC_01727]
MSDDYRSLPDGELCKISTLADLEQHTGTVQIILTVLAGRRRKDKEALMK